MNSPKNFLIAILCLTTIAGGVFAWQLQVRSAEQAATLASQEEKARAELAKKLHDAERHAAELETQLAALRAKSPSETVGEMPPPPADEAGAATQNRRNGRQGGRMDFAALMQNPEIMKLMSTEQKSMLDGRYSELFKKLNLTPEQLEKFKDYLVEKQNTMRDVMMAAREQGLNPRENRDEIRALAEQANAELDAALVASMGKDKFDAYKNYEATAAQRALVDKVAQRLSYGDTPLSSAQNDQLVALLTKASAASGNAGEQGFAGGFGGPGGGGGRNITVTDELVAQAQAVGNAGVVTALKEIQAQQQAQKQLRQLMRDQAQGAAPATTTTVKAK